MSNKNRLFEMMDKVSGMDASMSNEMSKRDSIVQNFIKFSEQHIGLTDKKPEITLSEEEGVATEMRSFGKFTPYDGKILVVAKFRNLADVLRTLAHEMVHFKQLLDGKLDADSGDDGSNIENEANSVAAVIMRKFGKENPDIYNLWY